MIDPATGGSVYLSVRRSWRTIVQLRDLDVYCSQRFEEKPMICVFSLRILWVSAWMHSAQEPTLMLACTSKSASSKVCLG